MSKSRTYVHRTVEPGLINFDAYISSDFLDGRRFAQRPTDSMSTVTRSPGCNQRHSGTGGASSCQPVSGVAIVAGASGIEKADDFHLGQIRYLAA